MSKHAEQFFADEFFAPEEDAGREITLTINGRAVPVTIRTRGITNEDRMASQLAATTVHRLPNGKISTSTDTTRASLELAARLVMRWPFIDRATGEPLPITGKNMALLRGGVDDILAAAGEKELEREEAAGPFETPSDEG